MEQALKTLQWAWISSALSRKSEKKKNPTNFFFREKKKGGKRIGECVRLSQSRLGLMDCCGHGKVDHHWDPTWLHQGERLIQLQQPHQRWRRHVSSAGGAGINLKAETKQITQSRAANRHNNSRVSETKCLVKQAACCLIAALSHLRSSSWRKFLPSEDKVGRAARRFWKDGGDLERKKKGKENRNQPGGSDSPPLNAKHAKSAKPASEQRADVLRERLSVAKPLRYDALLIVDLSTES